MRKGEKKRLNCLYARIVSLANDVCKDNCVVKGRKRRDSSHPLKFVANTNVEEEEKVFSPPHKRALSCRLGFTTKVYRHCLM